MTQHTMEPWIQVRDLNPSTFVSKQGDKTIYVGSAKLPEDQSRIIACVNGSTGLNPAAYWKVVEAAREVLNQTNGWTKETTITVRTTAQTRSFLKLKLAINHTQEVAR